MTEQLRIFAGLQGFISAAALLALILFFTLATPFGTEQRRWSWRGPVNDWLYVLGAAPWIVASVLLVLHVKGGAWLWALTVLLCALILAGATVTVLMLAGRVGLGVQTAVATPMTIVGFIWLVPAAAAVVSTATAPRWLLAFTVAVLVALVAGGLLVGSSWLAPAESSARTALLVVGIVPAGLAMVAFSAWWLILASTAK